jgi:Flp pilus assembly protein TadG
MTAAWQRLTARGAERGATEALELVIAIPVLMILLVLGVAGGNIVRGHGGVDAAAAAAARAASLQRSPDTAQQAGHAAATAALADRGLDCTDVWVDVDTAGFADRTPGASVRATVWCTLPLAKYAVPGLPGSVTVTDVGVSPIDVFRERVAP